MIGIEVQYSSEIFPFYVLTNRYMSALKAYGLFLVEKGQTRIGNESPPIKRYAMRRRVC